MKSKLNPSLTLAPEKCEVRSVHPDTLIKAGFQSREAAQAWIAKRGKVGAFSYRVALSPQ